MSVQVRRSIIDSEKRVLTLPTLFQVVPFLILQIFVLVSIVTNQQDDSGYRPTRANCPSS